MGRVEAKLDKIPEDTLCIRCIDCLWLQPKHMQESWSMAQVADVGTKAKLPTLIKLHGNRKKEQKH